MDPNPFGMAVCRGEGEPTGFTSRHPQNDQFCYGGRSVSGGWLICYLAQLTIVGLSVFRLCKLIFLLSFLRLGFSKMSGILSPLIFTKTLIE